MILQKCYEDFFIQTQQTFSFFLGVVLVQIQAAGTLSFGPKIPLTFSVISALKLLRMLVK